MRGVALQNTDFSLMHFLSYPLGRQLAGLLALTLTVAGCQNSRPTFQFRLMPPTLAQSESAPIVAPRPAASAAQPPAAEMAAPVTTFEPSATALQTVISANPRALRAIRRLAARPRVSQRMAALLVRTPPASAPALGADAPSPTAAGPPANRQRLGRLGWLLHPRAARQQPAAENGLGTTVLGIVGILALLVGLVGLIFAGWGFFGWLAVGGAVALLISILEPYVMGYA